MDYYRFELERTLGIICSPNSNSVYDSTGKLAISGALENIYVWNIRTGQLEGIWKDSSNKAEVSVIAPSHADSNIFAAGYQDGNIRIWNLKDSTMKLVFSGHKTQVTTLAFDETGTKLASGSREGDIVLWDLISETGLYRLKSHNNSITGLLFSKNGNGLISTSKDTLLKVWDLSTQHCIETVVDHHGEITGLASSNEFLFTVGIDKNLRIFKIKELNILEKLNSENADLHVLELVETISRSSNERANWITVNRDGKYLCVSGNDKSVELWKIRNEEEYQKLNNKKNQSWLKQIRFSRLNSKVRALEFSPNWKSKSKSSFKLLCSFLDNQLSEVTIPFDSTEEISYPNSIEAMGHRLDCKIVAFSPDGGLLATSSIADVKIWNPYSGSLIKTIECEDCSSILFIPDSMLLLLGDNHGNIHLVNLSAGDIVDSIKAHEGTIRSISIRPDHKGFMTGGSDRNVKFWEFKHSKTSSTTKSSKTSSTNSPGIKLKLIKTLQMNDEILYLKYSPDLRYIAVATMDMTIKVFFEDSLRFYLSLYGHKLPVTALDISFDGKILISASGDKNVKIWSLEFGDCRKSIFAHDDAITGIFFVPNTKLFWTCSKDKTLKYWNAEKFIELQKLTGHFGEIWSMSMNNTFEMISTVSKDKTIRIWKQTEEMLFPEEERERQLEEQFEKSMIEDNPHEQKSDERASTKTVASLKAGERIMECIEAADDERRKWDEYNILREKGLPCELPTPGAFYLALGKDKTPSEFVLSAFEKIPLPDVEEALLCLPTSTLPSLLFYISEWLRSRRNIVMSSRILDLVLKLFHRWIMATPGLRMTLEEIRVLERNTLMGLKDMIGFNNVAMQMY